MGDLRRIRALATDVDGVLTDGGIWLGPGGEGLKRLSFRDIMGVSLGKKAGLRFALISGEGGPLLEALAAKLGVDAVFGHCRDKGAALQAWAEAAALPLEALAFLGDDVNDLSALKLAGHSIAPADAHPKVLASVDQVLTRPGGQGALREWVDAWLEAQELPGG